MVTIIKRGVHCTPSIGGTPLDDWVSCHMSFHLDQPVARATIVAPVVHGDYDDAVEIQFGTDPGLCSGGTPPPTFFSGFRRDVSPPSLDPRLVQHECIGKLGPAQEYTNADDPTGGAGGLWVQDLVPTGAGPGGSATPQQIVTAALGKAGIVPGAGDIAGTGRYYGLPQDLFTWHAGTHSVLEGQSSILLPQEAGESALDYILRYDQIDAAVTLDVSGNPISGGFYRTFESLSGRVYRVLIGGRPRNANDITTFPVNGTLNAASAGATTISLTGGTWPTWTPFYIRVRETAEIIKVTNATSLPWTVERGQNQTTATAISAGNHADWIAVHEFTENDNIASANLRRAYPEADYVLVKGGSKIPSICSMAGVDPGVNLGPWYWRQTGSNPYMGSRIVYDKNPPSSDMIQWDSLANAQAAGFGIDCETIAQARILFVNRIIVSGTLVTPEAWMAGPGQTVLVQGQWSQTGFATGTFSFVLYPVGTLGPGQPDRLLTGEPLWVQGVDYEISHGAGGAPVVQVTLSLLGGGTPDSTGNIPAPPVQ